MEAGIRMDPVAVVSWLGLPRASMQVMAQRNHKMKNKLHDVVSSNADGFLSSQTEEINCGVKSFH